MYSDRALLGTSGLELELDVVRTRLAGGEGGGVGFLISPDEGLGCSVLIKVTKGTSCDEQAGEVAGGAGVGGGVVATVTTIDSSPVDV